MADIVIEQIEEENESYSNDDVFDITSWGADLSFRELITMYEEDELIKPELQRKYVWEKTEASRFIESILLGLPVPSVFLAKLKDDTMLIIDGYQRIMSIYEYVKVGIFSKDQKVFKLSNSKLINERWRGKAFSELKSEEQRKIRSTTIHAIIFQQKKPDDSQNTSLFQVFERINTGGKTLNAQEVRNCVYQGEFNRLLFDLNKNPVWRILYGDDFEDSRMRDIELIVRFFAISNFNPDEIESSQISLKKYLNEFMGSDESKNSDILKKRKLDFYNVMTFALKNFGKNAFHNINEKSNFIERFHPTIFDAISCATLRYLESINSIDGTEIIDIKDKHIQLLQDERFQDATSIRTTNIEKIKLRISLAAEHLYNIKVF